MDLFKASDSIPPELLIAKMHTYGFDIISLTFFYSYLKQNDNINNTCSIFQIILSGIPQKPILVSILLNIFINDLL